MSCKKTEKRGIQRVHVRIYGPQRRFKEEVQVELTAEGEDCIGKHIFVFIKL